MNDEQKAGFGVICEAMAIFTVMQNGKMYISKEQICSFFFSF